MTGVAESVRIGVSAERVWAALTDWDRQGDWMLLTRVRSTAQDGQGVGGGVEGWTGIGPVGVLDTMVIRTWDPPHRCIVRHTGHLVRGAGAFEVTGLESGSSTFRWAEYLELPFGMLGRLGWPAVRPVMRLGMRVSLRRFARQVESAAAAAG